MQTVATYRESSEAAVAISFLRSHDIPAMVLDEHFGSMYPRAEFCPLRLQVPDQDVERALALLANPDAAPGPDTTAIDFEVLPPEDAFPPSGREHAETMPGGWHVPMVRILVRFAAAIALVLVFPIVLRLFFSRPAVGWLPLLLWVLSLNFLLRRRC